MVIAYKYTKILIYYERRWQFLTIRLVYYLIVINSLQEKKEDKNGNKINE
jgi:hypothetical protein